MITKVDYYRGYEIYFDTETEKFSCELIDSRYDKPSFATIKKAIDDYLKENSAFKPFELISHPLYKKIPCTVIGIRKDGDYTIQYPNGEKKRLTTWDYSGYWVSTPDLIEKIKTIQPYNERVYRLEKELEIAQSEREEYCNSFGAVDIKTYKQKQNG